MHGNKLVQGWNDSETNLHELGETLKSIRPDEIHLLLPIRPPVESSVFPTDDEGLLRARAILGQVAKVIYPDREKFDLSGTDSLEDAIIGIITRHPIGEDELKNALKSHPHAEETLNNLLSKGQAQIITRYGKRFYSAASTHFPEKA